MWCCETFHILSRPRINWSQRVLAITLCNKHTDATYTHHTISFHKHPQTLTHIIPKHILHPDTQHPQSLRYCWLTHNIRINQILHTITHHSQTCKYCTLTHIIPNQTNTAHQHTTFSITHILHTNTKHPQSHRYCWLKHNILNHTNTAHYYWARTPQLMKIRHLSNN